MGTHQHRTVEPDPYELGVARAHPGHALDAATYLALERRHCDGVLAGEDEPERITAAKDGSRRRRRERKLERHVVAVALDASGYSGPWLRDNWGGARPRRWPRPFARNGRRHRTRRRRRRGRPLAFGLTGGCHA